LFNPGNEGNIMHRIRLVVLGLGLGFVLAIAAQEELSLSSLVDAPPLPPPFDLPLVDPVAVPETGTFWSAQHADEWPPLPFNPVADFGVPVYSLGGANSYLYDDRLIDYEALNAELAAARLLTSMDSGDLPEFPGEGEEGGGEWTNSYVPIVYGSNDLWLEMVSGSVTNGMADLIIHNPQDLTNNPVWDIFATTNLNVEWSGLNGTNWTWVYRTDPGETNVTVSAFSDLQCYYRLGDTNDVDADGLSDIFEKLVSHSDASDANPDGDDLDDYGEYLLGRNPNAAGTVEDTSGVIGLQLFTALQ
jgi:hypothetical protein